MARDPGEVTGSNRQAGRERAFRLLAFTVGALFVAFASLGGTFVWYERTVAWVDHSHQVRNGIADVLQALTDAESARRGYVLSGDPEFAKQAEAAVVRADTELDAVEVLTLDNPQQQHRIADLRGLMTKRLATIDESMSLRRSGDADGAVASLLRGDGIAAITGVRRIVAELEAEEARLLAQRAHRTAIVRIVLVALLRVSP